MQHRTTREILLVDDDNDEMMLFELALQEAVQGIKFTHSFSCSAGLKELEHCKPDLIFLDFKLGARSGHDCLKEIKASARHCNIPVIMYSNSDQPKDISFSYQLGASLYFQKTSSFNELVQALREIIYLPWDNPQEMQRRYHVDGKYLPYKLQTEE